jgi:hypothetical protein
MPAFVLVHSPSVGPATWQPVADRLSAAGNAAVVPSLLAVADGEPPYWPLIAAAVLAALGDVGQRQPLVLVVHSNAGIFVPVIAQRLDRPLACVIFADATIPGPGEVTPMAEEEFLPFLRGITGPDGRLPRWTDWWDEADVSPMFPDPRTRTVVSSEQPRLPLGYYLERVPAPDGWAGHCAYLMFSEGYAEQAAQARQRGWPVQVVPGGHLHQIVDPDAVADTLIDLAIRAS